MDEGVRTRASSPEFDLLGEETDVSSVDDNDWEFLERKRLVDKNKGNKGLDICHEFSTSTTTIDIEIEAQQIFDSLINEAINVPGDHGIQYNDISNDWISSKVIREGRRFFHRNYFQCALAIGFTELAQYPMRRITSFVLRNERYNGVQYAYLRSVVTFMHIITWFSGNILNKSSSASKDVNKVRKLHQAALFKLSHRPPSSVNKPNDTNLHVLKAIHQDMAFIPDPEYLPLIMTTTPSVPMSQFDMVMVLGVFYFLLDSNPRLVGLHDHTDYESFIAYLGLVGKLLGIEDRFNLPLLKNPKVRKLVSNRIWIEIMAPCFKNFHQDEYINLNYFAENGFLFNPFNVTMYSLVRDAFGIEPASNTRKHVNIFCMILYYSLHLATYLVQYPILLWFANLGMKLHLWFGIACTTISRLKNKYNPYYRPSASSTSSRPRSSSTTTTTARRTSKCLF